MVGAVKVLSRKKILFWYIYKLINQSTYLCWKGRGSGQALKVVIRRTLQTGSSRFFFFFICIPGPCIQIVRLVCSAKLLSAEGLPPVITTLYQALPLWTRTGFSRHRRWRRTAVDDQVVWNQCRKGTHQLGTTPFWRGCRGVDNVKFQTGGWQLAETPPRVYLILGAWTRLVS